MEGPGTTKHIRMLDELLEKHQEAMNEWQRNFCNDVRKTAEKFALRPKQKGKVDEIWAEIVEGKGRSNGPVNVLPPEFKGWSVSQESKFDFYVAYKEKCLGNKMTLEDCTTVMDWLINSESDLKELFGDVKSNTKDEEPPYEEPKEELPDPF